MAVSGGRDRHQHHDDAWWLRAWLLHLGATDLAHGECRHTGCGIRGCTRWSVDVWAGEVAHRIGLRVQAYPARWSDLGRAAGLVRNLQMLDRQPVAVLALPGRRGLWHNGRHTGTGHAVHHAKARGIKVVVRDPLGPWPPVAGDSGLN